MECWPQKQILFMFIPLTDMFGQQISMEAHLAPRAINHIPRGGALSRHFAAGDACVYQYVCKDF